MTVVVAHPAWRRVPLGVSPTGLGEGVGDCRGAVVTQSGVLFGPPGCIPGEKQCPLLGDVVLGSFLPLNMLVTKEEFTSGHHDVMFGGYP